MSKNYERGLLIVLGLWLLCVSYANAQTPVTSLPVPRYVPLDVNGKTLPGGKVCTFAAGTTTPLTSYSESTGTSANTNPVTLDSAGSANIWLQSGQSYKIIVYSSVGADSNCPNAGVSQFSIDGINPEGFGLISLSAIADPSAGLGKFWLSSTLTGRLKWSDASNIHTIVGADTTDTLTNKSMSGASNTFTAMNLPAAGAGNSVTLLCKAGGQAAQTGTSADLVLTSFSCVIPANTTSAGKGFRVYFAVEHTTGAANVAYKMRIGGSTAFAFTWTDGASVVKSAGYITVLNNAGVQNAQTSSSLALLAGAIATGSNTGAFDFTQSQTLDFTFSVANTDTVTGKMFTVELIQ